MKCSTCWGCFPIKEIKTVIFGLAMLKFKTSFPKKIFAHRTDGVYKLYNKGDKKDKRQDICFMLNRTVASCTIFQTNWAKDEHANFGLEIDKPFEIIGNAPDKKLFNTDFAKIESDKIRLVCTSWSINKNKGFPYYKFLDENLDFNKYSFAYIGNDPGIDFKNIKKIGPFDSVDLATQLKQHDIFITASKHECCSNSLLEAMACGLPAVGLNSGGTPEVIGKGGELFNMQEDLIPSIAEVANDISFYSSQINIPSINNIANKYISFFKSQIESLEQ